MNTQQQIADGIAAELARQGKTRNDLTAILDLSKNRVYSRFHCQSNFTIDELSKIADYLHMSFMDLMHRCLDFGQQKSPQSASAGSEAERR